MHRVRRNALEAYAHQEAPFDELIDALGHDRALRPEGPVRVLFNVLNAPVGRPELFGLDVDEFDFERTAAQFDLSMHIDTEFSHRIHLEYATDLYSAASAARMLENYLSLAERLLAQPERHLSEYGMLSPAQMSLLRHGWNGARAPLPAQQLVHRYLDLGAPRDAARAWPSSTPTAMHAQLRRTRSAARTGWRACCAHAASRAGSAWACASSAAPRC